jgi:16S rRNA (cytosine1402-N4)-methyltransferase
VSEWQSYHHVAVLRDELVEAIGPGLDVVAVAVDCTLGGGAHSEAVLKRHPRARLIGLDRDPEAIAAASKRLAEYSDRAHFFNARFSELGRVLSEVGVEEVGAVFYDLGVSSYQLDDPSRGFGFRGGGSLDMRMDLSGPLRAEDVVNSYSLDELSGVLSRYGEERFARRISKAVVRRRRSRPFTTAQDLADVVKEAIPAATRRTGGHPARRTFQALRIEVNAELEELETSLPQAIEALSAGGRLAVISYHSLEDRIVKHAFREAAKGCTCPRDLPVCVCGKEAVIKIITKKPVVPTAEEVERNPRARSARMRVAFKTAEAA